MRECCMLGIDIGVQCDKFESLNFRVCTRLCTVTRRFVAVDTDVTTIHEQLNSTQLSPSGKQHRV